MNGALILLTVCCLTVKAFTYEDLFAKEWNLYKLQHGKSYSSLDEENRRMEVFIKNKKFVAEHNARFHRGEETFDVELNKYADWLPEEIERLNGMANMGNVTLPESDGEVYRATGMRTPSEVNWVKQGAVTPVKDQGNCGSCYAFSALGSLEGVWYRKTNKLDSLSVQNILDCSRSHGNQGCNGGFQTFTFSYIRDNKGVNSESTYPYEAKLSQCRYKPNAVAATCTGYVEIEKNEKALTEATANIGPIAVTIDARHNSFTMYKSGVYSEPKCNALYMVHAVLVAGYGVDPVTKREYWLVKNSWGPGWGEKGYVRIAKNANNMCGIASLASYPRV